MAPESTDLEMDDIDACNNVPDTANPCGHVGLASQTRGMNDNLRTPDAMVEGIDIGALEVVDHK